MDGLGAIKEVTELEDYDIKYSRLRALSLPIGGGLFGTIVVGGIGYAAYLKYFKESQTSALAINNAGRSIQTTALSNQVQTVAAPEQTYQKPIQCVAQSAAICADRLPERSALQ